MFKQSFALFCTAFKFEKSNKKNLIITIALEILAITLLYFLNQKYGTLYVGIQTYNTYLIWRSIAEFAGIAGVLIIVGGFITYYSNKLAFSIREGLTTYFHNQLDELRRVENVEQRIQEDLRNFGQKSCELWFAVFRSAVKLPLFLGVIVALTQWWVGLVILAAVVGGTLATKLLARKLIDLQAIQESNEATFRKNLISGEGHQTQFQVIVKYFHLINTQVKKLSFLQSGLGQTFVLLPMILLLPLYIVKAIDMGVLMQSANALGKVIDSLTVLIDQRQLIVNISTCLKRMETLK
jgi:ABC-type uncharacterized transport system fused permease/ATPase subunit